jgi:hypothetical protein
MSDCSITYNPVGTDTWTVGYTCPCNACQIYVKDKRIAELESRLRVDDAQYAAIKDRFNNIEAENEALKQQLQTIERKTLERAAKDTYEGDKLLVTAGMVKAAKICEDDTDCKVVGAYYSDLIRKEIK